MSKRFTAGNKTRDPWYLGLLPDTKKILDYVRDNCDQAGVWDVNIPQAEFEIGFSRLPKRYTHPSLVGIEYTVKQIAEEDVECRGLDSSEIIEVPHVDWKKVLQELNTPHQHELQFEDANSAEVQIQVEPLRGGRQWWLVKFVKFQWAAKDGTLKLNESTPIHMPVVRLLRAHGLLDRFRKIYPSASIIEKENDPVAEMEAESKSSRTVAQAKFTPPTMAEVLAFEIRDELGEITNLPSENRKEFFFRYAKNSWKGTTDWQAAINEWAIKWKRIEDSMQTGERWPETITQKKTRIEEIDNRILELGQQRYVPVGGETAILKPEARTEMTRLRKIKEELQHEIREGEKRK